MDWCNKHEVDMIRPVTYCNVILHADSAGPSDDLVKIWSFIWQIKHAPSLAALVSGAVIVFEGTMVLEGVLEGVERAWVGIPCVCIR
jgi:hypothetical protein